MRLYSILAAAVLIAYSAIAAAGPAGTWKGSMDTQMGTTEMTINIQPGTAIAGNVSGGGF